MRGRYCFREEARQSFERSLSSHDLLNQSVPPARVLAGSLK